jgi:23S rRNA (guanosine2251-2'-O)-methyltransferase
VPSLRNAIGYLRASGIRLVAATEKAPQSLYSISLAEPTAIIVGAEDEGISPELLRLADAQVYIPFCGSIASLNVSAAVMFEAVGSGGMQPKIPPLQRLFFSLNLFLRCYQ